MKDSRPAPDAPARLRFAQTRRGEVLLLVLVSAMAVLLSLGALLGWGSRNWANQSCIWIGVMSALLFAALLGVSIARPKLVTVRRVRGLSILLLSMAALAILFAVVGLFV